MRKLLVVFFMLAPAAVRADDTAKSDASQSVETGSFLPFSDTPATKASSIKSFGSYDGARGGAALDTSVVARLSEKFQLTGALAIQDDQTAPRVGVQYSVTDEKKQGVDFQLFGGLDANGFNEVPAVFAGGAVGGHVAGMYLIGHTSFELGTQRNERAAVMGVAGMRDLGGHVYYGFDSRLRVDLEKDMSEPEGEASWDLVAGPVAAYAKGRYSFVAAGGLAAREPREAMTSDLGGFATVGAGAVF